MNETMVYCFGTYRLDPARRQLLSSGFPVRLGGRAFDALVALIERRDRTVSKQDPHVGDAHLTGELRAGPGPDEFVELFGGEAFGLT